MGNNIGFHRDKKIGDQNIIAVDNSFLSMFSYPMLAGDTRTALLQPFSAILTTKAAVRLYGSRQRKAGDWSSLIGKTFIMGTDSMPYRVTGICDIPENSHLQFDYLTVSMSTVPTMVSNPYTAADYDFKDSDFWHYIQLRHGTDYKTVNAKLAAFSQRHFQGNKVSGSDEKFFLQPLSMHSFYSDFRNTKIGNTDNAQP